MNYQVDIRNFKSFPLFKRIFLSYFLKNYQDESMIDFCWNWQGAISSSNYGSTFYCKSYLAHRMSYIVFKGPVRFDQVVRHTCDNKLCVNPKHLILGTQSDNAIDTVKRNRHQNQKLNEECIKVIKWMLKYHPKRGLAVKLAQLHNVNKETIYDIKKERRWSWVKI